MSAPGDVVRLSDGRRLGYTEYGVPDGHPLLYFHGHPGARLEARFLARQAAASGIRLIGIDRPGMGLSDYSRGRALLDWPEDVAELADRLRLGSYAVIGFSGGGPYALACAYRHPDLVTSCGVVSGVGRTGVTLSFLASWLPWILTPVAARLFRDRGRGARALTRIARTWTAPDRACLDLPDVRDLMADSLAEAFRQGARGAAYDGALLGRRSWGFEVGDITHPRVHLWHGVLDKDIPVAQARATADHLAAGTAEIYPDDGHISVIVRHADDILARLLPESKRR